MYFLPYRSSLVIATWQEVEGVVFLRLLMALYTTSIQQNTTYDQYGQKKTSTVFNDNNVINIHGKIYNAIVQLRPPPIQTCKRYMFCEKSSASIGGAVVNTTAGVCSTDLCSSQKAAGGLPSDRMCALQKKKTVGIAVSIKATWTNVKNQQRSNK